MKNKYEPSYRFESEFSPESKIIMTGKYKDTINDYTEDVENYLIDMIMSPDFHFVRVDDFGKEHIVPVTEVITLIHNSYREKYDGLTGYIREVK